MSSNKTEQAINNGIGERLRYYRKTSNLSQQELGEVLEVSFQQIQKYERGSNRISAVKLQVISEFLNIPLLSFFEVVKQPSSSSPLFPLSFGEAYLVESVRKSNSKLLLQACVDIHLAYYDRKNKKQS